MSSTRRCDSLMKVRVQWRGGVITAFNTQSLRTPLEIVNTIIQRRMSTSDKVNKTFAAIVMRCWSRLSASQCVRRRPKTSCVYCPRVAQPILPSFRIILEARCVRVYMKNVCILRGEYVVAPVNADMSACDDDDIGQSACLRESFGFSIE